MGLTTSLNLGQNALATSAAESSVLSRNIGGANNPNYSLKLANLITTAGGETNVSVSRATNTALFASLLSANSDSASASALQAGVEQLQTTVGDTSSDTSVSALTTALQGALQTYASAPSDTTTADSVITAAQKVVSALNGDSTTVQQVREQADSGIAATVTDINSLLTQLQELNKTLISGTAIGADVTDALDTRDQVLQKLSNDIGITTVAGPNNSISVYTDSGATLFDGQARQLTFQPTSFYSATTTGNNVYVDGIPITGSSSVMAVNSGKLAGLSQLRDQTTVQYQNQLDEISRGLINAFAETDQTGGTNPALPGLFTFPGATALPPSNLVQGLAQQITVNANVDPSQGGNVNLLRDGGISDPSNPAYTYNTTGDASYTARITQLENSLSTTQSFDPAASTDVSDSVVGYATSSVSWLEAQRSNASNQADYTSTVASDTSSALSSDTGVNLDAEMSKMLEIENSYQASAKLISTVETMFSNLYSSI
jgi:flagellar hook-associated protein 1 FlgK